MVSVAADLDLTDYLRALSRRKYHFLLTFGATITLALLLAFFLPTRYRSEATLLIERQTIPDGIVESTVTGYVQEHIQLITQKILTYENLKSIAENHNLYADIRISDPGELVRRMREDFEIQMLEVKASDPDQQGTREATIAFMIAFQASTAETAQAITSELAKHYLDENERHRLAQSEQVSAFLESETVKLRSEIKEMESQLATFKQAEMNALPEVVAMNRQLYEKTQDDIDSARDRIRDYENRIDSLRAEIAVVPVFKDVKTEQGDDLLNAEDRMTSLVAQYVRATARYSSKHPDVIRLSREIRTLAEQTGNAGRADELMGELIRQQETLRQAEQKYGQGHPDVVQLQKSVATLEAGFHQALTTGKTRGTAEPNNPQYVALQSQLQAAQASLATEQAKINRYERKLEDIESRLIESPLVESQYTTLRRELDSSVQKYNELRNKQLRAKLAQELESGEGAERFSLASPAYLPKLPDSPNRIGILLIGMLLAGILGISVVAVVEYLDNAIHDERTITNILGVPPLAVIPRI